MDILDALKTSLLDLHKELANHEIRLIVGGGYGLYLKQHHLRNQNVPTILDMAIWPEARSTNDLDVFLAAEVVTDSSRMKLIRTALDQLGYSEVESAKFCQFSKLAPPGRLVKLDLLAGPLGMYENRVKKDPRRVKPRPSVDLHARRVDEALDIENACMEITVDGSVSSGERHQATVYVPQGFSYLLMKLFAFRDRKDDADKDLGRHHAFDVLRIVAMMTQQEYEATLDRFKTHSEQDSVREAIRIIRDSFADEDSIGSLRIREHLLYKREIQINSFLRDLHALVGI